MVESGYFEGLLYFKDWVHRFQVVQKAPSLIVFNIVRKGGEYPARELEEVAAHSRAVMGADCEIRFEFVDDILPSASGKYRYIISEVQ
jgi:phenylacetate-CoA ligase